MTNVINKAITEFEVLSSFPQYDFDYVDLIKELKACKEALEQPKEPQYLYVYFTGLEEVSLSTLDNLNQYELLGKIKLEVDDD